MRSVAVGTRRRWLLLSAVLLAALFAAGLHGLLLVLGRPGFTSPVSIALLGGLGISGAAQLAASLGSTRAPARPAMGRP